MAQTKIGPSAADAFRAVFLASLTLLGGAEAALQAQGLRAPWPWTTDTARRVVDLDDFSVLLQRDAIPPIDEPLFVPAHRSAPHCPDREPAIVLNLNGDLRAYPLRVLHWHEIVNDRVGGVPVSVTWCPLCHSAVVFDRSVQNLEWRDGQKLEQRPGLPPASSPTEGAASEGSASVGSTDEGSTGEGSGYEGKDDQGSGHDGQGYLDFGTTGMLRHSDLVLWDRQTESWWQQFTGQGLVGRYAGAWLAQLPSSLQSCGSFREEHPHGRVLVPRDPGLRAYGQNPYVDYEGSHPFALEGEPDPRLPPTARILGLCIEGHCRAYPWSLLERKGHIEDRLGGVFLRIEHQAGMASALSAERMAEGTDRGSVQVLGPDGEALLHHSTYAFAWFRFYPDSDLYRP
jgi:hypothetical protein